MNKVYLHKGQLLWSLVDALIAIMICARRWGKSFIVALRIIRNVLEMPGSTGVFVSSSFRQAHSRTLPSALMALEDFGWKRDVHYVIGHKPDKRLGFANPIFMPQDLHDVVWFANGTIMIIVSQEVVMSSNSLTINWLIGDEAKGLSFDKLNNELFPAMGGTSRYFNSTVKFPHLWGILFCTDMPVSKDGLWLINQYSKLYDKELCDCIISLEARRQKLLKQTPNTYTIKELSYINNRLPLLRNKALYYQERSIFDNIAIVGADYITRMERDLTSAVFRAEILCKRITEAEGKFYQCFSESIHTYLANNNDKLNNYKPQKYDETLDNDVEKDKPLAIAFDYNAQITWLVVSQIQGHLHKTLKSFFCKYDQRLREVIRLFCEYYKPHVNKTVIYYYNATAKGVNYVEAGHDACFVVKDEFHKHGWTVEEKFMGQPMEHVRKHLMINNAFSGTEKLYPLFNRDNNCELIQAISLTGTKLTEKGFRKDKSSEKSLETATSLAYELRTDASDAWDDNFLGCLLQPYDAGSYIWTT